MPSFIDPKRLRPHPANALFDPLPEAVYAALKEDIAAHGIHDALLVTPDFTLITGHHRAKAALELGLEAVPVEIQDVDAAEAERLLIADNVLRRQLTPMEQARLIRRLKEAYGIRQGARADVHKTSEIISEVQEALGLTDRHLRNLEKLNRLIPEIQALVADGRLGPTAGAALAALPAEHQQALWDAVGEAVTRLKVADIQAAKAQAQADAAETAADVAALRAQLDTLAAERDALRGQLAQEQADASAALAAVEAERDRLQAELDRLQAQGPTVVERLVERVVADPQTQRQLEWTQAALAEAQNQVAALRAQLAEAQAAQHALAASRPDPPEDAAELAALERRKEALRREIAMAERELGRRKTGIEFLRLGENALRRLESDWQELQVLARGELDGLVHPQIVRWVATLRAMARWLEPFTPRPGTAAPADDAAPVIDITAVRKE